MKLRKTRHMELGCKSYSRWAFYQIDIKGNDDILTTLQLWSVKEGFPNAFSPYVHRKTKQNCNGECLGGAWCRAQDFLQHWNSECWVSSTPLQKPPPVRSCVRMLALTSRLRGRPRQAAPCWGWEPATPTPMPRLPPAVTSPLEKYWSLGPPPGGTQLQGANE